MTRGVTFAPQNVNPFVKFGNFVSVFRQDRTNICSCCAVEYTFQVWWIVTDDVLREAPSFWRRSLLRWHLSCMWRRVVWHVYTDVGAYSFKVKKGSLLLWSCKHTFLRNIGNCLPDFTVSQIFPPALVPVFGNWRKGITDCYHDTNSACRDSNLRSLERQTSITDRNRSDVSERPDVGNSLYDMIDLLIAVGLSPGGSTHLHTNNI